MSTQYRIKVTKNGIDQLTYYPMYKWCGFWLHCKSHLAYDCTEIVRFSVRKEAEDYLDAIALEQLQQLKINVCYIEYVPKTNK